MATIFLKSGSFFGTASFTDPSIWDGGIVPTASDVAYVRGCLTTLTSQNFNQFINPGPGIAGFSNIANDGLMYWPGTQSYLRVGSIVGFPPTGSFFTYTDRDVEVKIDYEGTSGSYFINCKVDKAYSLPWGSGSNWMSNPPLPSQVGGMIPVGAYIQFRPGLVVLSGSLTASVYQTIIDQGGKLELRDSSSYSVGNYIDVRDGFLTAKDFTTVRWNYDYPSTASTITFNALSASYLNLNNYPFSQVNFEGRELRTNTTLSAPVSIGDGFLSVVSASGFEQGDWIFVGEENLSSIRTDDAMQNIYRAGVSSDDECFYVTSKDTGSTPNRLYVQRMNGLQGKIFATASATEIIVDEERYNVGDKVIINGQVRTITEVTSSYDYQLRDYNFQSGSNLNDWDYNPERSTLHQDWALAPGFGLTNQHNINAGTYKQAVVKDIFRDNVKVEAWISNFMQITASTTDSGSRSGLGLGVIIHADPLGDIWDGNAAPNTINTLQSKTLFGVQPSNRSAYLFAKTYVAAPLMLLPNLGITNTEGLLKYTVECSQGFVKGYINDTLIHEVFLSQGINAGRVGLWTTNPKFICTRFIVYAKCQKIKLNTSITGVKADDIIYETGTEYTHKTGDKVIKLYSRVVNPLGHTNLAFAYRGFPEYQGDNAFPYIFATSLAGHNDGTAKTVITYGPANQAAQSFQAPILYNQSIVTSLTTGLCQLDNGSVTVGQFGPFRGSITLDFTTPTTFNNVAFIERGFSNGQNFTSSVNNGITISGSNDTFTWFPLTSSIDIRGRHSKEVLRDYPLTSSVTYRYVRLESQGLTNSAGLFASGQQDQGRTIITSFVVRNLLTSSIQVNNASDLNIGDRIAVLSKSSHWAYPTRGDLSARLFLSGSASLLESLDDFFVITAKSSSVLTLNRPIPIVIDKDTYVFKLNRTVNFTGSFASGSVKTGRLWGGYTGNFQQRLSFKNVGMQFFDDQFPFQNTVTNGSINITYTNFYSPFILQGCSFYNNMPAGNGWNDQSNNLRKGYIHARHNVFNTSRMDGIQKNRQYSTATYIPGPYVFTGNYVFSLGGDAINGMFSLFNSSYNIYQAGSDFIGSYGYTSDNVNDRVQGAFIKINRNLYQQTTALSYTTPGNGRNFYSLPTEDYFLYEIKNNKINSFYPMGGGQGGTISRPITNLLLADKQSLDFNRSSYTNTYTVNPFYLGTNTNPGVPTNYMKNYNRYGYNIWTNYLGHIIKYNNDSWYRHYMYNATNYKTGFMSAQIQILEDVTSSFELSFDYYNDNSQIAYSDMSFTSSLASGIQVPFREKFAGALAVYVIKNGIETAIRILPKSAEPQSYYEKFIFDGPGHYIVALGTSNRFGFIALRNINSKFLSPPSEKIMVKSNPFTMKYFENTVDKLQIRTSNNYYPPTLPSKFRLKSKKPF